MIQNGKDRLIEHIAHGVSQLVPEYQEELWNCPVQPAKRTEWYLDGSVRHDHSMKRKYRMATAAACLLLCMVSALAFRFMPSASVYLDVNPGVTLRVNYRNRVTRAAASNEDGEKILSGMELRGEDLDDALYAVLGSMVHYGYLTESEDTVLVSVHSANVQRAAELEGRVADTVNAGLGQMICAGEVLSQQLDGENIDRTDLNATPGKAVFIEKLKEEYPQLQNENLQDMTIDQIVALLEKENLDYSDYLEGADGDKECEEDHDEDDGEEEEEEEEKDDSGDPEDQDDSEDHEDHSQKEDDREEEDDN